MAGGGTRLQNQAVMRRVKVASGSDRGLKHAQALPSTHISAEHFESAIDPSPLIATLQIFIP
jgi:hypothetical protein